MECHVYILHPFGKEPVKIRLKTQQSEQNWKDKISKEAGDNGSKAQMGTGLGFGKHGYFLTVLWLEEGQGDWVGQSLKSSWYNWESQLPRGNRRLSGLTWRSSWNWKLFISNGIVFILIWLNTLVLYISVPEKRLFKKGTPRGFDCVLS